MLRYSRSLVILALVLLLSACGETVATVGTSQSLGGEPTATATTAPPTATPAAPTATATTAATATATMAPTVAVAPTATAAPTATLAPTATVPATPRGDTPQRTPTVPAAAGGSIVTDADKRCQMALPAGVSEDAPGSGEFTIVQDGGLALLQSIEGADLGTTTSLFVQSFTPVFTNYQETGRKSAAGSEQIDFTGELINPVRGTMYFKQIDNVICNVILVVYTSSNHPYDRTLGTMIGSLQLVKP